MKKITTLLILFLFFADAPVQSQTKIEPNNNPNASELRASLSVQKDTLKLQSDFVIDQVDIFNSDQDLDYSKLFGTKSVDIPMNQIPKGRFIVNVMTNRKMIIMILHKENTIQKADNQKIIVHVPYDVTNNTHRINTIDSDTIYIKESREDYRKRKLKPNGMKRLSED